MSERYLFPCSNCEINLPVTVKQAGQEMSCPSCNQSMNVPTMREIRRLRPVEEHPEAGTRPSKSRVDNESKSWLFSGGLLLSVLSAVAAIWLWMYGNQLQPNRNIAMEIAFANEVLGEAAPGQVWEAWTAMTKDGLPEWRESSDTRYDKQGKFLKMIAYGIAVISLMGAFAVIASFFVRRSS